MAFRSPYSVVVVAVRAPRSSQSLLEQLVLAVFADAEFRTRSEIEQATGLSRAIVTGVIKQLLVSGELAESVEGQATGRRGRPAVRYRRLALGAPVNLILLDKGHITRAAIIKDRTAFWAGSALAPWSSPWREWSSSIETTFELLRQDAAAAPAADTIVAAPFPVTAGRGAPQLQLNRAPNGDERRPHITIPPWLQADPRPAVSNLLACAADLFNDANLAALGEATFGIGAADQSSLYVLVRDGVGSGLIINGKIVNGVRGMTGELAHVQVVDEGPFCLCGNRGCLATQTRDPRVIEVLSAQHSHPMTWPDVEELVHRSDVVAIRVLRDLGRLIGRALAAVLTVLDLDSVILDGGLGAAAPPLIDGLQLELDHRCPPAVARGIHLRLGALEEPVVHGAWAAAMRRRRERPGSAGTSGQS